MEVLEVVNTEKSHTVLLGHFRNLHSKAAVIIAVTVNPSYYGTMSFGIPRGMWTVGVKEKGS